MCPILLDPGKERFVIPGYMIICKAYPESLRIYFKVV